MSNQILNIKNVSYEVNGKKLLENISFTLNKNEKLIILGHNGSGKSLLIDCVLGNLKINGCVQNKMNRKDEIGILYDQFSSLPLLKVKEILTLLEVIYQCPANKTLLEKLDIERIQEKYFKVLSKGERKKVGLYAALFFNPQFLILDEPTDGLDPEFRDYFWDLINRSHITLLLTTHLWEEAKNVADKIMFIEKGCILNEPKSYEELLDNLKLLGKIITGNDIHSSWKEQYIHYIIEDKIYIYYRNQEEKDKLVTYISQNTSYGYSVLPIDIKDIYFNLKWKKNEK